MAYFQRKIQLSGFSAYPDGLPSQLIQISGVLLYLIRNDFFTATVVTRTPLNVTLHLNCLFGCILYTCWKYYMWWCRWKILERNWVRAVYLDGEVWNVDGPVQCSFLVFLFNWFSWTSQRLWCANCDLQAWNGHIMDNKFITEELMRPGAYS